MKQLILYFLFFVGAAFVFIQCAALFPSNDKPPGSHPKSKKASTPLNPKSIVESSGFIPVTMMGKSGFGTGVFKSYFNTTAFPLSVMQYIKGYSFLSNQYWGLYNADLGGHLLFYTPGINYTNSQLLNKHNNELQANNDRKK